MPRSASAVVVQDQEPQPLLRVGRENSGQLMWLDRGRAGSLQTAAQMARLVREDAVKDEGLERFAAQLLLDAKLDSHSDPSDILDVIFRYVQSVPYIKDSMGNGGYDTIQSARQTLKKGYGDCDDLTVLLATLLALIGFKPEFVLARYRETGRGFDHVYVSVTVNNERVPLDPTSRNHGLGWESPKAKEKLQFPIFGNGFPLAGLANFMGTLSLHLLNKRWAKLAQSAKCDGWEKQIAARIDALQRAVDAMQMTPAQASQLARQLLRAFCISCVGDVCYTSLNGVTAADGDNIGAGNPSGDVSPGATQESSAAQKLPLPTALLFLAAGLLAAKKL